MSSWACATTPDPSRSRQQKANRIMTSIAANHRRPRVVIIGAGFGGLSAAKRLAQAPVRCHRRRSAQLPPVPAAALPGRDRGPVAGRYRISDSRHSARAAERERDPGEGVGRRCRRQRSRRRRPPHSVRLSHRRDRAPSTPISAHDWSSYAPGLKTIDDATYLRRRILLAFERAETESGRRRAAAPPEFRRGRRRPDRRGDGRRHRRAGEAGAGIRFPRPSIRAARGSS